MKTVVLLMISFLLCTACEESVRPLTTTGGSDDPGGNGDSDDPTQQVGNDHCESVLTGIIRDFPNGHPDFYHGGCPNGFDGIVAPTLDADGKPTVGSVDCSSAHLNEWYRTIDGVNMAFTHEINLTESTETPGLWVFDSFEFFPVDNIGFGNDIPKYPEHNYLFTSEFNMSFLYEPGQTFMFRGDDDLWVFINGVLAIDVGGIHSPVEREVNIDDFNMNTGMGMVYGQKYPMQIFHAERNPIQSNFHIETTIGCFTPVVI